MDTKMKMKLDLSSAGDKHKQFTSTPEHHNS